MFRKAIRSIVTVAAGVGLMLTMSAPAQSAPITQSVGVSSVQQAPSLVTATTATSGGGTSCVGWGYSEYGNLCAVMYRGQSGYLRPYGYISPSSTSPAVTSSSIAVKLCKLNSLGACISTSSPTETFSTTTAVNKRPRCTKIVRGEIGDNLPCEKGGAGYTPGIGTRYRTIATFKFTRNGVTKTWTIASPIIYIS